MFINSVSVLGSLPSQWEPVKTGLVPGPHLHPPLTKWPAAVGLGSILGREI